MRKIRVDSVYFNKLKGLHDLKIQFVKPLTAIMGVNGAGKTTVIHALACIYQPDGKGEKHKFPEFFVPNTDSLWKGSEFSVVNEVDEKVVPSRSYCKKFDRWSPRYDDRPKRNVYYLGIDTCLPEIEKNSSVGRINYSSQKRNDKLSKKVLEISSRVLNKDYDSLIDNEFHSKHFLGVLTHSGLKYSSLSMGTGEQRTIKILEKVLMAEPYSLILIDELDLLLHVSALRNLVRELYKIADNRNLQIIFTTHSLEMLSLSQYVGIQYISEEKAGNGLSQFRVYDKPSSDIIRGITGETDRPIKICVEDDFSKAIIKTILRKLKMSSKASVIEYGAAKNAFSFVTGQCINDTNMDNMIVVLDGDIYKTDQEKEEQLKKVYTGTEKDIEEKRKRALSHIIQYNLPDNISPEKYIHDILIRCGSDSEVVQAALRIQAVEDSHLFVRGICDELGENIETVIELVSHLIEDTDEWKAYISPVKSWLEKRRDL